jgi:hypothetical protein
MNANSGDSSPQSAGVLGAYTAAISYQVVSTLGDGEVGGNTSNVDVDMQLQLLSKLAGCDSLPNVLLADVPPTEACPEGSAGEE